MLKEVSPNVYYSVIGGVYNDVAIPFGSALTYRMAEYLREIKAKAVYTYVSSNNPMAVRAHSQYGYVIDEIKYVYIKHK